MPTPTQPSNKAGPENYTVEQIAEMTTTWRNFNGFTAVTCGACKAKANVLAGGAGWFCACGHYNLQCLHNHQMPHENPDYGPPSSVIHQAFASAGQ